LKDNIEMNLKETGRWCGLLWTGQWTYGSVKDEEFLEVLGNYQLLRRASAACYWLVSRMMMVADIGMSAEVEQELVVTCGRVGGRSMVVNIWANIWCQLLPLGHQTVNRQSVSIHMSRSTI
jgi:hypothetical protein